MTPNSREAIAEMARVYTFVGFVGSLAGWIGFVHQLHLELADGSADGFGWPLVLWALGAVFSTVLLTASASVAWLHRYLEASPSEPAGRSVE